MIIKLSDDKELEIKGNQARVLPDGIWHQFSVNRDRDISIVSTGKNQVLFKYGDDIITADIRGNVIVYETKE